MPRVRHAREFCGGVGESSVEFPTDAPLHCCERGALDVRSAYWPQANKDLDAISIPKAEAADAKAAKAKLQAKVDTRLDKLRSDMIAAWNAIPDSPGAAEGAGYKAGQAVLDGLIAKVRDHATKKGWK